MESDHVKIVVALIGAGASCAVAVLAGILGWITARRAQRDATTNQQESARLARELEQLKARLGQSAAESKARLDYEYEARKRLYEEYEPLRFQLLEVAEGAYHRIQSLARTARMGCLEPVTGWLNSPDYYLISTVYKLLAPMAIFKLIQRKLTVIDLSVSGQIATEYRIAKCLYLSWTDDFEFARLKPPLKYAPEWDALNTDGDTDPAVIRKQGVPMGYLDTALEEFIAVEAGGLRRIKSYGEVEAALRSGKTRSDALSMFVEGLLNFHPRLCPVFWRMLIAQAEMYRLLFTERQMAIPDTLGQAISDDALLDWRQPHEVSSGCDVTSAFAVAGQYLASHHLSRNKLLAVPAAAGK